MSIYLTRHGETNWNIARRWQGRTDIPLNDNGRKQADEASRSLRDTQIDLIFTSPLIRAVETAKIFNQFHNTEIITDNRIIERSFGSAEGWSNIDREENGLVFDRVWDYQLNIDQFGIEKVLDLSYRVYDFLDDITQKYADKNILIVTHGGVTVPIRIYFNQPDRLKNPDLSSLTERFSNCQIMKFDV